MAKSHWQAIKKLDFHAHVVLHERPDTDLRLNTAEMMLQAMEENNVERAVEELGLPGLKIHPSNLRVSADDPRLGPIVEAAGRLGIPIL